MKGLSLFVLLLSFTIAIVVLVIVFLIVPNLHIFEQKISSGISPTNSYMEIAEKADVKISASPGDVHSYDVSINGLGIKYNDSVRVTMLVSYKGRTMRVFNGGIELTANQLQKISVDVPIQNAADPTLNFSTRKKFNGPLANGQKLILGNYSIKASLSPGGWVADRTNVCKAYFYIECTQRLPEKESFSLRGGDSQKFDMCGGTISVQIPKVASDGDTVCSENSQTINDDVDCGEDKICCVKINVETDALGSAVPLDSIYVEFWKLDVFNTFDLNKCDYPDRFSKKSCLDLFLGGFDLDASVGSSSDSLITSPCVPQ